MHHMDMDKARSRREGTADPAFLLPREITEENLIHADWGLREELGESEQYRDLWQAMRRCSTRRTLIYFQDRYGFHYIFFQGTTEGVQYHCIGPFRLSKLTQAEYEGIWKSAELTERKGQILKAFAAKIPQIKLPAAFAAAREILLGAYGSDDYVVETIVQGYAAPSGTARLEEMYLDEELLDAFVEHEKLLIRSLTEDDSEQTRLELSVIFDQLLPSICSDMSHYRAVLSWANSLMRKTAYDTGIAKRQVFAMYFEMHASIEKCRTYSDYVRLRTVMVSAYNRLFREYSIHRYSPVIRDTVNYIRSHLQSDLDLPALAAQMGFSTTYILHKFKKEVGVPPMQFVNRQRMQYAKRLLETTSISVQEIAQQVGIQDSSYFSKQFKKNYGQTPSQFRRSLSE